MMRTLPIPARSAGVGLVTAIFLLVVLAGLGVAMVALYTGQQAGSNLDIQGARAYQAARAGIEWGLWQARRGTCSGTSTVVAMPNAPTLQGFTLVVSCRPGAGNAPATILSRACNMPVDGDCMKPASHPEYVRRQMEAQA